MALILPVDHRTKWDRLERLEDLAHVRSGSRPSLWMWESEREQRVKQGLAPKLPEPPEWDEQDTPEGKPVQAYVNHGRWLGTCTTCGFTQHISLEDNRFWCLECRPNDWAIILYPPTIDLVERILQVRPIEARNWTPEQDWEDLVRENREHGLPGMIGQPA